MKFKLLQVLLISPMLLLNMQGASAEKPEQKGLKIAQAADARDAGFSDFTANMVMTLKNRAGNTSSRIIRTLMLCPADCCPRVCNCSISTESRKHDGHHEFEGR